MANNPSSRRRGGPLPRRCFSVTRLRAPTKRPAAPIAGDALRRDAESNPANEAAAGTINGVLQFLLAPANRYWPSLHHFWPALPRGHANMVDRWLIAVRDQAQDVVGGGENHKQRDQGDADPEADFLRALA